MATITYAFDTILGETTLNANTTGVQSLPAAADLAGGGYISVWDNQGNISGRIFENSGAARTAEFPINTTLTGIQTDPEIVGLVGGRAVAVWTDSGGAEAEIRAQMINSDGTLFGPEIFVSEQVGTVGTAGAQTAPDVAALSDGGWVVTWQDNDGLNSNDVLASIYNADSAPAGQRASRSLENHHLVAGLRLTGLVAPFVLDGPINRDAFEVYVEKVLVPELRLGDVVVMDNLVEPQGAKRASADRGRRSDAALPAALQSRLQPVENAFAKLKALLRKAAERTINGLWAAIGRLIDTFTPSECANYFTAAGVDAT